MTFAPHHCLPLLGNCKNLRTLTQLHASLIKSGAEADPFIAGKLLLHCAVAIPDSLFYARRLFLNFPDPDVFMYNTIVRGFADSDAPDTSIMAFVEMRRKSLVPPDSFSFAFILKAAANFRSLGTGLQMHCQALKHGLDTHLFVGTTLISMYGECGCVTLARMMFDEMPQLNVVTWNAVITACFRGDDVAGARMMFYTMPLKNLTSWNVMLAGYTKAGELESAKRAFKQMPVKDDVSWSTMIVGFAHSGCFSEAFGYFRKLLQMGMRPNEVSLTGILSACSQAGAFVFPRILHGFVEKSGFSWIVSVNNALIDSYSKCGNVAMARLVFESMLEKRSIVSWTSMIAGLAMYGHGKEALKLFDEMIESGIMPDGISFISLLYACSHAGLIEEGQECFSKMKDVYNIEPAIEHYGCMVDLYGRAGKVLEAYDFICQMPIPPNDIIWRTLLGACSIHGSINLAEQVKQKLSVLDPNNSGDHVLLSNVYAVAGKWKNVAVIRRSMNDHKIKKTPGWSSVEVEKTMYNFIAGEKRNEINTEAYEKLNEILLRLKVEAGYNPEVTSALHDIEEEEKEDQVAKHSEKLAVAFGITRLPKVAIIRIVKNLRICKDCHTFMKLISRVYGVEIVVRDRSRFHSFKNGSCTCQDYW